MGTNEKEEAPEVAASEASEPIHHLTDQKGSFSMTQHSSWCDNLNESTPEGHCITTPWCEHQVLGIKTVTWPTPETPPPWGGDEHDSEVWVSVVRHPENASGSDAPIRYRDVGVQLAVLHHDGNDWQERLVHITADAARSLSTGLLTAADISDGVKPRRPRPVH